MGPGFNPFALRKAKIPKSFGLSECNRVKVWSDRPEKLGINLAIPGVVSCMNPYNVAGPRSTICRAPDS